MSSKITDEQFKQAIKDGKTIRELTELYGISERNLRGRKAKLVRQGWSPEHDMTHAVPDGFHLRGTSTLYDDAGNVKIQWVKSNIDAQRQLELIQEAVAAMAEDIPKYTPYIPSPDVSNNLLNLYVITDYHLGMLAWGEETGEDWDVEIAEDLIYKWISMAVARSPDAEIGVLGQLGDFMHTDGMKSLTPGSGHLLDSDTRFPRLVRIAMRVIRRLIDVMLTKHNKVIVVMPGGNHDEASTPWLREHFAILYDNEPRVQIDTAPGLYMCVEHGQTSLFFHHLHKRKVTNIDSVFAAKFRDVFGRTKYSYSHGGHLHHDHKVESNLMICEQHRTLCAPDAYAALGGWISGRDAKVITYSKEFGEVGRVVINPEMLK